MPSMTPLPPGLKHLVASRAPLLLEGMARLARISGITRRRMECAPSRAARILAYHQTPPSDAAAFRRQMQWLAANRQVVDLASLARDLGSGAGEGRLRVAITFDDGFANNFEVAVPILDELRLPATFFITTDFIDLAGASADLLQAWGARVYRFTRVAQPMRWDQLRRLHEKGYAIAAHTRSHINLGQASESELRAEIVDCLEKIEAHIGIRPRFFAYPYGKSAMSPPETRRSIWTMGDFDAAFSTERGWNSPGIDPSWFHRDSMEPGFSPCLLESFLCGLFDKSRAD